MVSEQLHEQLLEMKESQKLLKRIFGEKVHEGTRKGDL